MRRGSRVTTRWVWALVMGMVLTLALAGCGDDTTGGDGVEGDTRAAQATLERAEAAVDGVLHDLATDQGLSFKGGSRSYAICGDTSRPRGVILRMRLNFGLGPRFNGPEGAVAAATQVFEEAGWSVERPPNPEIVLAREGELTFQIQFGSLLAAVEVSSECVKVPDDAALSLADEPSVDLTWR